MEETERQRRSYELFRCSDDYINEIMKLREVSVIKNPNMKKTMDCLFSGLRELEQCRCKESAPYRKKQRWWSRFRDRRIEKAEEKAEAKRESEKSRADEIEETRRELQKKIDEFERRVNGVQQLLDSKGVDVSLFLAPPSESEANVPEVVKDDEQGSEELIEEKISDEQNTTDEDGCMKF